MEYFLVTVRAFQNDSKSNDQQINLHSAENVETSFLGFLFHYNLLEKPKIWSVYMGMRLRSAKLALFVGLFFPEEKYYGQNWSVLSIPISYPHGIRQRKRSH